MAENKKNLAKAVIANAVRGGTKIIPLVGALLEQTIFGTKDQLAAQKEADRVKAALVGIRSEIDSGTATLAELLEKVDQQSTLSKETSTLLQDFIAVIRQGELAEPSQALEQAMETLFQQHGHRLEDVAANIEESASRLEQALETIETIRSQGDDETAPTDVDRVSLILKLNALGSISLGTLIAAVGASHFVSASAAPQQRVTDLVEWADDAGPGILEVYRVARKLDPNFS